MTEQQNRGTAIVSVVIVGVVSAYLLWLSLAVVGSDMRLGDYQPGRTFMLAIHNWSGLSLFLKSVPIIVTLGITIFARYKLKDWQFFALIILSMIGIVASLYLYLEVSTVETARKFWAYSPVQALETYDAFVGKAQASLAVVGGWLIGLVAIQLGVKLS